MNLLYRTLALCCYNEAMFLVGIISWWYGRGWIGQWRRIADRWAATVEYFSIGQLFATLFSPYRQISAGSAAGTSFSVAFRSFVDRTISRVIGSFVRTSTIIIGALVILFQVIYETLIMVVWWFLPLFPVIGFILLAIGWVPSWT